MPTPRHALLAAAPLQQLLSHLLAVAAEKRQTHPCSTHRTHWIGAAHSFAPQRPAQPLRRVACLRAEGAPRSTVSGRGRSPGTPLSAHAHWADSVSASARGCQPRLDPATPADAQPPEPASSPAGRARAVPTRQPSPPVRSPAPKAPAPERYRPPSQSGPTPLHHTSPARSPPLDSGEASQIRGFRGGEHHPEPRQARSAPLSELRHRFQSRSIRR